MKPKRPINRDVLIVANRKRSEESADKARQKARRDSMIEQLKQHLKL